MSKKIFKKLMSIVLAMALVLGMVQTAAAVPVVEHFSDENTDTSTFESNGFLFNLTGGRFKIANYMDYGWTGTVKDDYYVDNYNNYPPSAGVLGSITISAGTFKVNDLYVMPGQTGDSVSDSGDVIIRGKLGGVMQFESTFLRENIDIFAVWQHVDLSSYNTYSIDELEFEVTDALRYLAIDAFKHESTAPATKLSTSVGTTAFTEGNNVTSTPVEIDGGLTISDGDSITLSSAAISITGNFQSAEDVLTFTNNSSTMGNIVASYNSGTGILTLTSSGQTATLDQWQAALRSITYTNSSDSPNTSNRTISFKVNDGTADSNVATKSVSVSAVNDVPVIATSGGTTAFTEGSIVASIIDGGLTISDVDSSTLSSATISITDNIQSGQDVLAFTNNSSTMGNISASYDSGTGVLTLTSSGATATLAQWQAALRSITYTNSSDSPNTSNRTISFKVNDGTGDSNVATKSVSVSAVNDAPTDITLSSDSIAAGSTGNNSVLGTISSTDPDSVNPFTYSLVAGTGNTNNASFNISGTSLRTTTALAAGTYHIRLRTTDNGSLFFEKAFTITVTKSAQTAITYNNITKTYGDADFTHTATGGSGTGAFSYESSDTSVASIDASGNVTILKAGSTTLTATKAADDSFNSASDTCTLTVSPKTITASAIAIDKTYTGDTSATGTISFIGLIAGDEGQVTGSGIFAFSNPDAGDTKTVNVTGITLGGAKAGNYTLAGNTTTATANISKADQASFTITDQPTTPLYGQTFNLGTSGGSGTGTIVTWSATVSVAVTNTGEVTINGAGIATIMAIKAGDNNYNQAIDTYTFIAGKATPTIGTVTASSIYVGDTLSNSSLSRTDLAIAGSLSWETPNTTFSSSGNETPTYKFTVSDADNYNNLTGQSVTVEVKTRKILSVEAQTPITDKIYGTTQSSIGLPSAVNVTVQGISGDVSRTANVTWSGYNPNILTAQTLTGTINLTGNEELNNSDTLTTSISVTLQPLVAKNIDNVSAKIKVGAIDGTALLKALVTDQFDASVDTAATDASNWTSFPADYNTTTSGSQTITVRVNYVAGCTPTYKDVIINYEIVNPSSLAYTTSSAAILATDANNASEASLLSYVNNQRGLTVQWPSNTIGDSIVAINAPTYATLPNPYVKTGTTYAFSQSYLGHTLSQSITVNEVQQAQPSLTVNYADETIDTTTAMSYSTTAGIWVPCTSNMSITPWLGQTVNFKTAGADFKVDSDETTVVFAARAAAPTGINATINDSKTEISFSGLAVGTAYEYSTDGLIHLDLSADGKLTVVGYQNSVDVRKKFVAGVSVHSADAIVPVNYTMTFNSTSGSAVSAMYAVSGAAISAPSAPTRSGYTFAGWNSAETGTGSAITFPYTMTDNITVYAKWTVYTAPPSSNNTPSTPTPQPVKGDFEVVINGEKQEPAGTATEGKQGDQTKTTVTLDEKKLDAIMEKIIAPVEGEEKPVITVPVSGNSDIVTSQLNGQNIKDMENKEVVLEIKTETATYSLPAQQINIDEISEQIGKAVELKDIKVQIEIAKATTETAIIVENSAKKGEFTIIAPPVDFTVTCTHGNNTIDVSSFNAYVERTVAIPEGVDPSKITTGIVVDPDGTVRHVPTKIVLINGKYFAKINSLTNSTYSVVWHPLEFKDVEKHWAKEAINDMGSRLVISGVGNDLFAPDKDITRAEFAAIIVNALGLKPGTGSNPFTDVKNTDWYCKYIQTAYEYGIIAGIGKGKFGPLDKITHEQAMTMIAKAMKITDLKVDLKTGEAKKLLAAFGDLEKSSAWAKDSIAACVTAGILPSNMSKTLAPRVNITRAEVADIVRKLLQKSNLI